MSDNIPFEIQTEIMRRLPVKSLIQFRSVSKAWKSVIDSKDFIAHYSHNSHILVSYEPNYLSFVDDLTFPKNFVFLTVPSLVSMLRNTCIIGSSHGLLCLHGVYLKARKHVVVLWNFVIKKAIPVVVPNVGYGKYETVFGCGVCGAKKDPKIVKITYIRNESDIESISCIPSQVEVFTLSTGAWRRPYSNRYLPRKSIQFWRFKVGVEVDGVLYWLTTDRDGGFSSYNLIVSFDIESEEFGEVNLPHSSTCFYVSNNLSKLGESLVVLHSDVMVNNHVIDVWMMEDGVSKLFTKLFTINVNTPDASVNKYLGIRVYGFRKSGEAIIRVLNNDLSDFDLAVYDPYSKHIKYLGINGMGRGFIAHTYMETLLLLDQPNYATYDEMETIKFLDDLAS